MVVEVGLWAFHQIDIVGYKFEGCFFEAHVSWRTGDHETIVYVDYMTVSIDHDIVVMSVLDLKNVLDYGVAG